MFFFFFVCVFCVDLAEALRGHGIGTLVFMGIEPLGFSWGAQCMVVDRWQRDHG